jgi:Tol biopolymer transport system component
MRFSRRMLLAMVTSLGLMAAACGGEAGRGVFEGTQPTPAEPSPAPPPASLGSLAYGVGGDIYVADWDGANAVRIADGLPPSDCGGMREYWAEGPIWSPDGRYLAYRHTNCEAPEGIWNVVISDAEGNLVAEFPSGRGWDIGWSPDSTRVAVWVSLSETIGVFGLDGVRQALLTVPPGMLSGGDHDPMWLPDGESLMFPWEDVVVPIDGSTPYHLQLPDLPRDGYVTYSPDGSRVAYLAERSAKDSLVVAEADGSNPQVVFDDWTGEPVWSPAGDRIAFVSFVSTPHMSDGQLRLLDVATGTVTLLAEAEGLSVIDFSPEGDRILLLKERTTGVSSLWSVNADGSDLRRLVAGTFWGDWLSPGPTP